MPCLSSWQTTKRSQLKYSAKGHSRFSNAFQPRKVCTFFLQGQCTRGSNCTFAHSEEELAPDAWSKQQHFFDEAPAKLNRAPAMTEEWAAAEAEEAEAAVDLQAVAEIERALAAAKEGPTKRQSRFSNSFQPRKVCTFFLEGQCTRGSKCTFAHSEDELAPDALSEQQHVFDEAPAKLNRAPAMTEEWAAAEAEEAGAAFDLQAVAELERALAAAEEGPTERQSMLQIARDFGDRLPSKLCQMWLRHPLMCVQGDSCPLAHGLLELGIENTEGVAVETRGDGLAADVRILNSAPSGAVGAYISSANHAIPSPASAKGGRGCKGVAIGYNGAGKGGYKGKGTESWGKGSMGAPVQAALPMHSASYDVGAPSGQEIGLPQSRFAGGSFKPVKLCSFWVKDPSLCQKGDQCTFAHGVGELAATTCGVSRFLHTGFMPSKYCPFFAEGKCAKGLACPFAHSPEEMSRETLESQCGRLG